MATNSFNNAVKITRMAMDCLENNTVATKFVNRQYRSEFADTGAKQGDTINVRIPGFYGVRQGSTAQPQGYNDTYVPVTLSQFGADLEFTTKDLKLCVEDGDAFQQNVLNPLVAPVASYIDGLITSLYTGVTQYAGTPGTKPTDLNPYLQAGAMLDDFAAPRDGQRSALLSPWSQASMVNGLKGLFHSASEVAKQYEEGTMGMAGGLKFSMDQNIRNHTVGTFGTSTPAMAANATEGATTLNVSGWASGASTLKKGDIISVANVYAVNPVTKLSTGQLQQFVVTADTSDSSGAMATLPISPAIYATGANQNVTALPLSSAAVYVYGKQDNTYSAKVSNADLVFHRDAFGLVNVDLPKPDSAVFATRIRSKKLDISMRLIQFYNGATDKELYRIDVLAGAALFRPKWAVRVQG